MTPEQMRALALRGPGPDESNGWAAAARAALRAAADQLEALPTREQVLDAITHGNPYSTCDFEEDMADRIMSILTADTAPQEDRDD